MSRRRRRPTAGADRSHLKVLPGEGRRLPRFRQAAVYYIIIILTALLVLQAGYHWMGPFIMARRLEIVTAAEGCMERRIEVEGMIARRELVLRAPCSGIILELAPPGERAAAGAVAAVLAPLTPAERQRLQGEEEERVETLWEKIGKYLIRITGGEAEDDGEEPAFVMTGEAPEWLNERVTLALPEAGLLLHRLDGWENPVENTYLTAEEYAAVAKKPFEAVTGLYVEAEQPIMKVVDNWQWFYRILLPLEEGRIAAVWDSVLLEFHAAPGPPLPASLCSVDIDAGSEVVRLEYSLNRQLSGCEDLRRLKADLIFDRRQGVIIPAAALVQGEGAEGVFVNQGGRVKFKAVEVIRVQEGEAMVEGLEAGSMVIGRPELAGEGRRLN